MSRLSEDVSIGWPQKLGLILSACVVSLILGEVAMRLVGLSFPVFDTYDEVLGVKLMPGKEGWYRKEGEAYLRINSLGYRDREHELTPPQGKFRIAVLGDSFTEARQMPIEDTYWDHLGKELGTCPALAGLEPEVLSFGIGGYSTSQAMLAYDLDARRFEPDLVLLGFFAGNDVRENSKALTKANSSWLAPKPFHALVDGKLELSPPDPQSIWERLIHGGVQHSRLLELVNELRRHWSVWKKRADREARVEAVEAGISSDVFLPLDAPEISPDLVDAWTLTARLLAELNLKVRDNGARFMVATIPTSLQTHPDLAYREALTAKLGVDDLLFPDRQLAKFGRDDGYPVFPLVGDMQATVQGRHFHGFANTSYGHGHLNAEGHQVMAQLLAGNVCRELGKDTVPSPAKNASAVD